MDNVPDIILAILIRFARIILKKLAPEKPKLPHLPIFESNDNIHHILQQSSNQ